MTNEQAHYAAIETTNLHSIETIKSTIAEANENSELLLAKFINIQPESEGEVKITGLNVCSAGIARLTLALLSRLGIPMTMDELVTLRLMYDTRNLVATSQREES